MNVSPKIQAAAASYARAFAVAAVSLYASGVHDTKALAIAAVAAVVGPALRAVNMKDPAFGLVAKVAAAKIEETAAEEVKKARKAPAKKAAK